MIDPAPLLTDPAAALPAAFLARVRTQFSADEYAAFLDSYTQPSRSALRVNTLKISPQKLKALLPGLGDAVPRTKDCFFYPDLMRPGLSPYHEAGLYYIQEPSAMLPAMALEARPGERVLDLCAAPGGKTTAIAADMRGQGLLVANEIIPKRAAILSQNVERLGIVNAVVTSHSPAELSARFPGFFDRILVDAPCSGEGMFKKEPQALTMWSPENVAACAARQDGILHEADKMLRPGGRLVYSTCTFSPDEDEDCVARFIAAHPDYTVLSMETLWPHRFPGEGQFLAVLQKSVTGTVLFHQDKAEKTPPSADSSRSASLKKNGKKGRPDNTKARHAVPADQTALSAWQDFADGFFTENASCPAILPAEAAAGSPQEDPSVLYGNECTAPATGAAFRCLPPALLQPFGEQLRLLPESLSLDGLKVLRPGLHLGTLEKGRFVPSHSLALALSSAQASNVLDLTEHQACDWITGLSLPCDAAPGWCLVCVNGFSLGFGKVSGGVCKNHYPKGLRRKTVAIEA